jgi:T5orf172 domain
VTQGGGWVYFIGGSEGPIKIGWTATDARRRLRSLQTGNPMRLAILGETRGSLAIEAQIHRRLSEHRLTGEWFERGPALNELAELELERRARIKRKRPAVSHKKQPELSPEEHEKLLDEVVTAYVAYEVEHGPILERHVRSGKGRV